MNIWKCKPISPTDTLQQKIEITSLKSFLAGENTSVLIPLYKNKEHIICFMFILEVFLNYKSAQVYSSSQSDTGEGQNTPLLYVII